MKIFPGLSLILSIAIIINQTYYLELWKPNMAMMITGICIAIAFQSIFLLFEG